VALSEGFAFVFLNTSMNDTALIPNMLSGIHLSRATSNVTDARKSKNGKSAWDSRGGSPLERELTTPKFHQRFSPVTL
jgi:hypothetical protein